MLALDNSLARIETPEADVLDLFRSPPIAINLTGARPEPRSAIVCAVRKKSNVQVYVALATDSGRNFFYTKPDSHDSEKTYHASLDEALAFARSMGFAPERVDLNYSPAMRAVVVRNFKIFTTAGGKAAPKKGNAPTLAYERALQRDQPSSPLSGPAASVRSNPQLVEAAKNAATAAEGKERKEQEEIADVLVKMGRELDVLRAERDALAAQVQELSAVQFGLKAELNTVKTDSSKLLAERDSLAQAALAMEKIPAELAAAHGELAQLSLQRDEADRRNQALLSDNAALTEAATIRQQDLVTLTVERDAALTLAKDSLKEKEIVAAAMETLRAQLATVAAERDAAATGVQDLVQKMSARDAELDAMRVELTALRAEQGKMAAVAASGEDAAARIAGLEQDNSAKDAEVAAMSIELTALQTEVDKMKSVAAKGVGVASRIEELEQESAAKDAELAAMRIELTALRAEIRGLEELEQQNADRDAEIAALRTELTALRKEPGQVKLPSAETAAAASRIGALEQAAAAKDADLDSLRAELQGMKAERERLLGQGREQAQLLETLQARLQEAMSTLAAPEPDVWGGAVDNAARAMIEPDAPASDFPAFSETGQDGFFSGFADGYEETPEPFLLQVGQTAIGYGSPDEIVEVHKSYNVAHIAPDGNGQEPSEGYICCVRRGDAVQVYVAIVGTRSGKRGIYCSEVKPADERAVAATLAGAATFLEQVGLMVERVDLDSPRRAEVLSNCPVLQKPAA